MSLRTTSSLDKYWYPAVPLESDTVLDVAVEDDGEAKRDTNFIVIKSFAARIF